MATEVLAWSNPTPATLDQVDGTQCYNLGERFTSATSQSCSGVQWRVPTTLAAGAGGGIYAVAIWNVSSGIRVAYKEFTPVAGGYQNVAFDAPITLTAGAQYIATTYTNHYAFRAAAAVATSPSGNLSGDSGMLIAYNGGAAGAPIPTTTTTTCFYVSPIVDAPGATTTPVTSTLTAKWRVYSGVTSSLTGKWRVYSQITSSLTVKWRLYSQITSSLTSKWRIRSGVTSSLTSKWRVFSGITSSLTSKWRVFSGVTSTLTSKWRLSSQVTSTFTAKWQVASIPGVLLSTLTAKWRVYSPVTSTLTGKWRISGGVVSTLSSKWRMYSRVLSTLTSKWSVDGSEVPVPTVNAGYLMAQRTLTALFIADDPTQIVLVPVGRVRTPTGGWSGVNGAPRESQTVKMVLLNSDQRPTVTVAGIERLADYHLVGPWDMEIAVGDVWSAPDGTRWEVLGFTEGWDYMTKAFIGRHIPREVRA